MLKIPPNFVSVRLLEDDKQLYQKVQERVEKSIGLSVGMGDLFRLAMKALAEKHGVK